MGVQGSRCGPVLVRTSPESALRVKQQYRRIQGRLNEAARVPARKDINADFPLRGFVTCGDCDAPLTGCWSRGRTAHYPYYQCFRKGCPSYGKSIPRAAVEDAFENLLDALTPNPNLFRVAGMMFEELWNHRLGMQASHADAYKAELAKTVRKVAQLFDRIVETDSSELVTAYERRVRELETRKAELAEQIAACGRPLKSFYEGFRTAMSFLASPRKIWDSERLEDVSSPWR